MDNEIDVNSTTEEKLISSENASNETTIEEDVSRHGDDIVGGSINTVVAVDKKGNEIINEKVK